MNTAPRSTHHLGVQMTTTVPALATTDLGHGDLALLHVPGWCGGREVFDPLLEQLAQRHRAVSVDLPGHGSSPAPAADFGTAHVVEAISLLLDTMGEQPIVPVALSHAGWAALELVRRLGPERIPAVVLL